LTDSDVPLATLHWTDVGGLRWVDNWSARRNPYRSANPGRWAPLVGSRRAAEGEAMFFQFQDQIDSLFAVAPGQVRALDTFVWLPPAGFLPISTMQGARGFSSPQFFDGLRLRKAPQPVQVLEGARVPALLRLAQQYPPQLLSDSEFLWIYVVRENQQA